MVRSAGDHEQLDARLVLPPGLCAEGCGTSPSKSSRPVIPPVYWVRTARDWLAEARAAWGISIDAVVDTGPVTVGVGFGLAVRPVR